MKRNILKENMRRFNTKNLDEAYAWERNADGSLPTLNDATKQHQLNIKEQTPATAPSIPLSPAAQQKTTAEYERKTQLINNRKKVTPEQLMKLIPVGQTAVIMTADETPGYLLVVDKKDNYYELI